MQWWQNDATVFNPSFVWALFVLFKYARFPFGLRDWHSNQLRFLNFRQTNDLVGLEKCLSVGFKLVADFSLLAESRAWSFIQDLLWAVERMWSYVIREHCWYSKYFESDRNRRDKTIISDELGMWTVNLWALFIQFCVVRQLAFLLRDKWHEC